MQGEGISWKIYGNAIVGRDEDRRRTRRPDALHLDLLRRQRKIVLMRLLASPRRSGPGPSDADLPHRSLQSAANRQ